MNYSVRISERVVSRLKRRPCPRHHLRVASIGSVSTEHFHATQHALWVAHRSKFECPTSEMGRVSRAFSWSMKLRVTVREMKEGASGSAIMGFVSRVTPVQTALRNCTGDEGGPFGFGEDCYRKALGIIRDRPRQYDPEFAAVFVELIDKLDPPAASPVS